MSDNIIAAVSRGIRFIQAPTFAALQLVLDAVYSPIHADMFCCDVTMDGWPAFRWLPSCRTGKFAKLLI